MLASVQMGTQAYAQDVNGTQYVAPEDEMAEAMVIMEAMFPEATREQIMVDMAATMGGQMATAAMQGPIFEEPGIRAIMDEFIADLPETMRPYISSHLPRMVKATATAYTREFTLNELQDISQFAATPSGQRYFSSAQSLLTDPAVAAANQQFFEEVAELQGLQAVAVQQRVQEYLEANPDVLERLMAAGVGQEGR
jgi:hypothetical protein